MDSPTEAGRSQRISAAVTAEEKRLLDMVRLADGDISNLLRDHSVESLLARGRELDLHFKAFRVERETAAA